MEKVRFSPSVLDYTEDLIRALFEENYFAYAENAVDYVRKLATFCMEKIPVYPAYTVPLALQAFGEYYVTYHSNPRTTWYIFFLRKEDNYLVTHIFNNHCPEAALLRN